jgi:hypothetical protein
MVPDSGDKPIHKRWAKADLIRGCHGPTSYPEWHGYFRDRPHLGRPAVRIGWCCAVLVFAAMNGIPCQRCGWTETAHDVATDEQYWWCLHPYAPECHLVDIDGREVKPGTMSRSNLATGSGTGASPKA